MTARTPITQFELDPERLEVIAECTKDYDVGAEASAEWPNNIISRRTVVYGSGRIARAEEKVSHFVDADELGLCRRLSSEIAAQMARTQVGMLSEAEVYFRDFFIAGNVGEALPSVITDKMIRERFGDTIFPPATITVERMAEEGVWWRDVVSDGEESGDEYLVPWRRMIDWFKGRAEFVDTAFVRIGSDDKLYDIPEEEWPDGTVLTPSVLPRLALGLSRGGSLVGLFGYAVQT